MSTHLDGRTFFALTSAEAHGCGGPDYDADAYGRDTLVWPSLDAAAVVESLTSTWHQLCVRSGSTEDAYTAARQIVTDLGGTWPASPAAAAPTWGPGWVGTLREFWTARTAHDPDRRHHVIAVQETLSWARLELFRAAGATPVKAYLPGSLHLVHEYGCMCGHSNYYDDDGKVTLYTHDGGLYAVAADLTRDAFDAWMDRADTAAQAAYDQALAKWPTNVTPAAFVDLSQPFPGKESEADADLTWEQWHATRVARAEQIAAAVNAHDYDQLDRLGARVKATRPDAVGLRARFDVLSRADLVRLAPDTVTELAAVLGRPTT